MAYLFKEYLILTYLVVGIFIAVPACAIAYRMLKARRDARRKGRE
jgi:hypothetical protein